MSAPKIGFWARIGGMLASFFLKGKDKQKAIDISEQVGGVADELGNQRKL